MVKKSGAHKTHAPSQAGDAVHGNVGFGLGERFLAERQPLVDNVVRWGVAIDKGPVLSGKIMKRSVRDETWGLQVDQQIRITPKGESAGARAMFQDATTYMHFNAGLLQRLGVVGRLAHAHEVRDVVLLHNLPGSTGGRVTVSDGHEGKTF
jgi:hypothetical protein